jgi:hypothetical protein
VAAAVTRAELARVTPALEHDEVLEIYRAAATTAKPQRAGLAADRGLDLPEPRRL